MSSTSCLMNRSLPSPAATQASHRAPHSLTHTSQRHSLPIHNTPTQQLQHITKPHANDADYYFLIKRIHRYHQCQQRHRYTHHSQHNIQHHRHCNKIKSITMTQQHRLTRPADSHCRPPSQALPLTTDLHYRLLRAERCLRCTSRVNSQHRHTAQQCLWPVTLWL